jgi:hypothetical protein
MQGKWFVIDLECPGVLSILHNPSVQRALALVPDFNCRGVKLTVALHAVDCVWNVMVQAQKPDFVFRRNGRVHLNRRGRQFSRLLAAEMYTSAVVMLNTSCSEVVWRVLASHFIRQFPLHFSAIASPCAITFQLDSTKTENALRHTSVPQYVGMAWCLTHKVITWPTLSVLMQRVDGMASLEPNSDKFLGIFSSLLGATRGTRWRSWLRHCVTSRKVAGSITDWFI